jgi:hypothetical protein
MKTLKLLVPDQIYQTASELARIEDAEIGQFCLAALSDGLTAIQQGRLDKERHRLTSSEHVARALPDTVCQVHEVCRWVWLERKGLNDALRETAYKFGVLESTVRDKCTRRINLKSITAFSELLGAPKNLIDHLCTKYVDQKTRVKNLFETILPTLGSDGDPIQVAHTPPQGEIREMDLINAIIACLKRHGGKLDKPEVEREVFEVFKASFQHSWYQELVGGIVPRWQKNVHFARNTACNTLGLIKPPEQSGRGIWELTDKGREWVPQQS